MLKKTLKVLLVLLIVIQFYRPTRNLHSEPQTFNITKVFETNNDVKSILKKACNDCHSNNTTYPWYANIQPVSFWMNNHVNEGKQHLNFDSFANYSLRKQFHKLEEIDTEVREHKTMPMESYTWVHKDAILTDLQISTISTWVLGIQDSLKNVFHIDSLVRKKQ